MFFFCSVLWQSFPVFAGSHTTSSGRSGLGTEPTNICLQMKTKTSKSVTVGCGRKSFSYLEHGSSDLILLLGHSRCSSYGFTKSAKAEQKAPKAIKPQVNKKISSTPTIFVQLWYVYQNQKLVKEMFNPPLFLSNSGVYIKTKSW